MHTYVHASQCGPAPRIQVGKDQAHSCTQVPGPLGVVRSLQEQSSEERSGLRLYQLG